MNKVLVFGALHHDVVVDAPSLPRLDETLVGSRVDYRFGGKGGNQSVAAARMGACVSMLGRVGRDAAAETVLGALDDAGVEHSGVTQVAMPTGMSVAVALPSGGYGAVIVSGANLENDGALPPGIRPGWALIQNEVPEAANLVFARGLPETCKLVFNAAPARPLPPELCARTDLLIVNRVEAQDLTGHGDPKAAGRALFEKIRGDVVVTLGGDGVLLAASSGVARIGARHVSVVSTHGAGDMFSGALVASLSGGAALADALHFAQTAASMFVGAQIEDRAAINQQRVAAALLDQPSIR